MDRAGPFVNMFRFRSLAVLSLAVALGEDGNNEVRRAFIVWNRAASTEEPSTRRDSD